MLIDPINNIQKKLFKSITDKRAVFFFFLGMLLTTKRTYLKHN